MKEIKPPYVKDVEELQLLADNANLGSYPQLLGNYIVFRDQYLKYISNKGDPWSIESLISDNDLKGALVTHYNSAPKGRLEFIDFYRRKLSPDICPMCGGPGNGTVDHYLPKDLYPEFSFFSKNLIPACNCNSLRGTTIKGDKSPKRVIHPYFDTFLNERLYTTLFAGDFDAPKISIDIINKNHPNFDILKFHLDEVINNAATQGWFEKNWAKLSKKVHLILKYFLPPKPEIITVESLKNTIENYIDSKDLEFETPNNWHSIFYSGIIDDIPRLERLVHIINRSR